MSVPKQIKKQTEAVQQLYADLNTEENSSKSGEGTPSAEGAEAVTAAVDGSGSAAAPDVPGQKSGASEEETFKQRYHTLQGKYNAEVPELARQNRELGQRIAQLEQLLSTMQAVQPPAPETAIPQTSPITDEDREEYGESIDMMQKVSAAIAAPLLARIDTLEGTIAELRGNVVPRVEQLAAQQYQSADQKFWSDLSAAVPDWKDVNDNPDFQTWLLELDPLSGLSRQAFLDDAQRHLDASRVVTFFEAWKKASGTLPAQPTPPAPTSELERQITPGRGRSSGAPPENKAKTYTPEDITAFFRDVQSGVYKNRKDERDATERDIFAAQREGRIVQA